MSVNGVHNIISDDRAVEPFHKKNYCRLCLREKEKLIPIFESGDEISKFIEKVFFIKVRMLCLHFPDNINNYYRSESKIDCQKKYAQYVWMNV